MQQFTTPAPQGDAFLNAVLGGMKKVAETPAIVSALAGGWVEVDRDNKVVTFYIQKFWAEHFAKSDLKRGWLTDCVRAALRDDFSITVLANTSRIHPERPLAHLEDAEVWRNLVDAVKTKNRALAALLEQGSRIDVYEYHLIARVVMTRHGFHQLLRNPTKRDTLIAETTKLLGPGYLVMVMSCESENSGQPKQSMASITSKAETGQPARRTPKTFDEAKQRADDGTPFWDARELANLLGYDGLANFAVAIEKSKSTYQQAGLKVSAHIREVQGEPAQAILKTIHLSEMGSYLAIQAADTSIKEVAQGHVYFAQLIFQQRSLNQLERDISRLERREQLKDVFKQSGKLLFSKGIGHSIRRYHDAGNRGLYNMGREEVLARKGLKPDDNLFDYSGETELWANGLFRSMANDEIEATPNLTSDQAARINWEHGANIREALAKKGVHSLPENLPPAENIKEVEKRVHILKESQIYSELPSKEN